MEKIKAASLLLRVGIAFTLVYAGIASFLNPNNWIGFLPSWIEIFISLKTALYVHDVFVIALGIWLLTNWKAYYAGIVSGLFFFFMIIFNIGAMDLVFRDVGLFFAALALIFLNKKQK